MEKGTEPAPIAQTACGGTLKDTAGYPSALYQGERVYFCTKACLRVFEQGAEPFTAGEVVHPLDEDE